MRKTLVTTAVLALAACGPKRGETGAAADTSTVTTPAPAATDSTAMMSHDSMTHSDSTMARDTATK